MEQNKNNQIKQKEIPINIKIPPKLKTNSKTKFFIYIPNHKNIQLTQGKNFENGFWSINKKELTTTHFILSQNLQFFQFLLIYKNTTEEEIISNIYYKDNKFTEGPFIKSEYTIINPEKINLRIESITPTQNIKFEIEGIPPTATLSKGEKIDDTIWEIRNEDSKNLILTLPQNLNYEKIHLTITATNQSTPYYKTTFNLIINIKENQIPHKNKFKEIQIPTLKILKDSKLKFNKYILAIKNLPENCCIHNAIKLENKWITEEKYNQEITIQNFNTTLNEFEITLEYIIINKELPNLDNTYTKKYKCNFKDKEFQNKNFTKCITCHNHKKCNLFENFMNYIGNSTILKHIINK